MRLMVIAAILSILAYSPLLKASGEKSITANDWQLSTEGVKLETMDGQEVFHITSGELTANNVVLQDGIIEFDMFHSGQRAFFYVYFRQQSQLDSEVLYFRTHKSNAPDTIQYAPVFQGMSAWQLYHGDSGTASAELPAQRWIHVKLQIQGQLLTVWVGDNADPVMKDMPLSRAPVPGSVSIRGNIPRQSKASFSAYVRNIRIQPLPEKDYVARQPDYGNSQLTQFVVSQMFAADKTPILKLPDAISPWTALPVQANGMLEFLRWRNVPDDLNSWAVAADTQLSSPRAQTCVLNVGFSDTLTLFLNDQALVFADASYRYIDDRQEGLLHGKQLSVFLPLKKGANQLRAIVADSFGGWGFTAAIAECEGLSQHLPVKN
jgi:hypothetical protein